MSAKSPSSFRAGALAGFCLALLWAGTAEAQNTPVTPRIPVLIAFTSAPGPADEAVVRGLGGTVAHTYHLVPAVAATIPATATEALLANPRVTAVEVDGQVTAFDAELDNTWGVKRIAAGTVHAGGTTGVGAAVAVIDSGIDYYHPDLSGRYAGGYDFVNNDADPMDDNSHGTHVAGTVAAVDDGVGVVGAAPGVAIYALKVLDANGSGYWSDIIAALEWVVDRGHIAITNNSYGSGQNPGGTVEAAFANAEAAGVLSVAAAGNGGNCGGKGNSVGYPARYSSVIAVAAITQNDTRPCFSSTGANVELAAPGVAINSTVPGGGYDEYNGTSMASPHVAGTAALLIDAVVSDLNGNGRINDEMRDVLAATALDLGDAGRDEHFGFGLVQADAAVAAVVGGGADAVYLTLGTSQDSYDTSAGEITALLTAVLSDEAGDPITGLIATDFTTLVDGGSRDVFFNETSTAGIYTGSLDLSGLADGTHTVEVTATDLDEVSGSGSASFSTGSTPAAGATVTVASIAYSTNGGPNGTRHLDDTLTVVDGTGNPVSGALVAITLTNGTDSASGNGTTDAAGVVTFSWKNAPAGCYATTVDNVEAAGLTWDGATPTAEPSDPFCK